MGMRYLRAFIGVALLGLGGCENRAARLEWRHLRAESPAGWKISEEAATDSGAIVKGRVGDVLVQIREWTSTRAQAETQYKGLLTAMQNLYESFVSPYPGVVSSTVVCPDKFKPVREFAELPDEWAKTWRQLATDRFQYGVCDDKNGYYRSYDTLYFCAKRSVTYEVRLFTRVGSSAVKQMDELHAHVHCR